MHLEHLAQNAKDEIRPLLREDALPRPLLPADGDPVRVFHQLRGGVGEMEEVEGGSLGFFGGDVGDGEVVLRPGPGEGLDFQIEACEVGVLGFWVWVSGVLDLRGDEVGLVVVVVVLGYRFSVSL